jgi:hypothetical protein
MCPEKKNKPVPEARAVKVKKKYVDCNVPILRVLPPDTLTRPLSIYLARAPVAFSTTHEDCKEEPGELQIAAVSFLFLGLPAG